MAFETSPSCQKEYSNRDKMMASPSPQPVDKPINADARVAALSMAPIASRLTLSTMSVEEIGDTGALGHNNGVVPGSITGVDALAEPFLQMEQLVQDQDSSETARQQTFVVAKESTNAASSDHIPKVPISQRRNKHVEFDRVEIREYAYILGCNPGGTMGGPPLSIDWEHLSVCSEPLESYEARRSKERKRHLFEILTTKEEREAMLHAAGFSGHELRKVESYMEQIRDGRLESALDRDEFLYERQRHSLKPHPLHPQRLNLSCWREVFLFGVFRRSPKVATTTS